MKLENEEWNYKYKEIDIIKMKWMNEKELNYEMKRKDWKWIEWKENKIWMRNKEDNENINYRINEIEWKRKRLRIIKLEI